MTSTWLRRVNAGWLLFGLTACVGTPVTEPPSATPPELPQVTVRETLPEFQGAAADATTPIGLSGGPGSTEPNSLVWAINLDGVDPAVVARADADGSFEVPVAAMDGDELRMHVLVDGVPSAPLDMIFGSDLVLASPDHGRCVRTTPTMLDFGTLAAGESTSMDLVVENTCAEPIDLALPRTHPSATDFRIPLQGLTTLAEGESTTLSITFEPLPAIDALRSTVLLIEFASAAENDRMAVTLWGRVR